MKIAEFYKIPAATRRDNPGKNGKVEIKSIDTKGHRELVTAILVDDKRHARRLALAYDAKPWNF